jgi:formylglycine-generating enzyme required for sulfatase activity
MMLLHKRGGSWFNDDFYCKVAYKGVDSASYQSDDIGFRMCIGGII